MLFLRRLANSRRLGAARRPGAQLGRNARPPWSYGGRRGVATSADDAHPRLRELREALKSTPDPTTSGFVGAMGEFGDATQSVESSQVPLPSGLSLETAGDGQKVLIETYGCQMNVSDSELVRSIMLSAGYELTESVDEANVFLINTCAIRENAETKVWNRLETLSRLKKRHRKRNIRVGVLGCMAERLKDSLLEKEQLVDMVVGPDAYRDLPELLRVVDSGSQAMNVNLSLEETYADVAPVRVGDNHSAFVSIMRGCNNMCTYCIVPFTRGRERSRAIESIVEEVRELSRQGYKEVVLLGQNVNSYNDTRHIDPRTAEETQQLARGFDTVYRAPKAGHDFAELLDQVSAVDPEMRVRFTSPHPKDFPDRVLKLVAERPNICKQLHMPAQSGSTSVLESMRRGYTREAYSQLVRHIREMIPGVTLSSDFIFGFCGETEEDHQATLDLLREVRYEHAFLFAYSMRERTRAHRRLEDDVPEDVKKRRLKEGIELHYQLCKEDTVREIGKTHLVLVEKTSHKSDDEWAGRTDTNRRVVFARGPVHEVLERRAADGTLVGTGALREVRSGDYVAVRIDETRGITLRGVALAHSTLQHFHRLTIASE